MDLLAARERIGGLIDAYALGVAPMKDVAAEAEDEAGVPKDMWAGPVDEDGWVEWTVLPSAVKDADIEALGRAFGVRLPLVWRAYLGARAHCFDQVHSKVHDQLVMLEHTPTIRPLGPARDHLQAWSALLEAGYLPFSEWGDGWGPMCVDLTEAKQPEVDGPVVWIDHERLVTLGEDRCRERSAVQPHAKPLYPSLLRFFDDVFSIA